MSVEARTAPLPKGPRLRWLGARLAVSALVTLTAIALAVAPLADSGVARANTFQMSSDNSASGWYPNEAGLTASSVSGGDFGELFDTQLTGEVYAQPLVVQPTVLAVTESDYAYGINSTTGAIEWTDSFGSPANPLQQIGCGDVGSGVGITGTPVIDSATGIAYFVAATDGGTNGATEYFMEAINVQTGALAPGWPTGGVRIQGSADGDSSTVFNGEYQTQRPGLILVNGVVYAAFGSSCDFDNWEGWLIGVKESTGTITTMWSTEEDVADTGFEKPGGGIWQSGAAPVVDSQGDIFVATGNGDIPSSPEPGSDLSVTTYGEGVIELHATTTGQLEVVDWFIASNANQLNIQDGDLGSGGPVALPSSMGTTLEPDVLLEDGKQGLLYVMNMNNLGGYEQGPNETDDVPSEIGPYGGVWSKPSVWPGNGGYVYITSAGSINFATNGGSLQVFQRVVNSSGYVSFQLVGQTANSGNVFGYGSGSPIVTSNGTNSGSALVWVIHSTGSSGADSQLEAFNPVPTDPGSNGTLEQVWSSGFFTSNVFSVPGVDNGIVYVGTKDGTLLGFGALASSTPALTGTSPSFSTTVVSQSVTQNAVFTATAPTTISSFVVGGSSFSAGTPDLPLPASLSAGESITVPVTFTPNALGSNEGWLTANEVGTTSTVPLSGQGETSAVTLSASPDELDFGLQPIGGASASLTVTYTNISSNPINITGFKSPVLPFSVSNPPADQTLQPYGAAGDSLSFTVHFAPPGSSGDFVHEFNSVATLDTSVGNFGEAVTGSAAPPAQITTIPGSLNFGDVDLGSSETLDFLVGDQGGLPLTITESVPPNASGFVGVGNPALAVGQTIQGDTSFQENVQFTPTALGTVSAQWLVEANDGSGVQTITMTGTGVPPPPSGSTGGGGGGGGGGGAGGGGGGGGGGSTSTSPPVTLTITTLVGRVGTPLTLTTSGDPNGGSVSYRVIGGTARGCVISGDTLSATSGGTCVVTATKLASGANPEISSSATSITFTGKSPIVLPKPLTLLFSDKSYVLSNDDEISLRKLVEHLRDTYRVKVTGYAKGDAQLALRRARAVAAYLVSHVKIRVTVEEEIDVAVNEAIVTTT